MSQHVIAHDDACPPPSSLELTGGMSPEKLCDSWDAFLLCDLCHVVRRLDAENRNALCLEILKQVAVVTADFNDKASLIQVELFRHSFGILAGVILPGFRIRGEIGVFSEDFFRAFKLFQLNEETLIADTRVERIERLHLV